VVLGRVADVPAEDQCDGDEPEQVKRRQTGHNAG
jgi:hypothetical protein